MTSTKSPRTSTARIPAAAYHARGLRQRPPEGRIYPDSDDPTSLTGNGTDSIYDRVEYKCNRQREVIERKDQTGTVHTFEYDKLGRSNSDKARRDCLCRRYRRTS